MSALELPGTIRRGLTACYLRDAIRDQEEMLQDSYAPEDPTKRTRRQEAGPCTRYTGRRNYQGRTTPDGRQLSGNRRPVAT
jgi:hypothetical protein